MRRLMLTLSWKSYPCTLGSEALAPFKNDFGIGPYGTLQPAEPFTE